jgi:hypothetical protein
MSRSKSDVTKDGPRGRKDSDGTEAVIKLAPLRKALADLLNLKGKVDTATGQFNDSVKAIAERTGLMSSVVKKLVKAKAGDDYAEAHRKVEQAALVFDEFAGEKPSDGLPAVGGAAGTNGNGSNGDPDPLAHTDLALDPAQRIAGAPEGITQATVDGLAEVDREIAAKKAGRGAAAATTH